MTVYIFFIIIALISSIIANTIKENRKRLIFFPFLLSFTVIVELVAWYMSDRQQNNLLLYNLYSVFEITMYLFFLKAAINLYSKSNIVLYIIIIYFVSALINIFFLQGVNKFNTYTYILGCLLIAALCIVYFTLLFKYTVSTNLVKEPEFWIVTALMFWHAFAIPYFGILNFIANMPIYLQNIIYATLHTMNILLNILFTIGFLCRINIRKLLQ